MSKPKGLYNPVNMTPQAQRERIEKLLKDIWGVLCLIFGALTFGIGVLFGKT